MTGRLRWWCCRLQYAASQQELFSWITPPRLVRPFFWHKWTERSGKPCQRSVLSLRQENWMFIFICITGFIKMPENRHSNMPVMNRKKASYSAGCKNQTSGLLTYKSYWFFLVIMDILWRRRSTGPSWKEVMVWGRMCVQTQKVSEKNVRNNRSP